MKRPLTWSSVWPWVEPNGDYSSVYSTATEWPKISIVTPNYNYAALLEATLRSVVRQKYPNLEYIVIDDGSDDNSVEVIRKYERDLAYWEHQPNRGQYATINKGFSLATGEIFAWLNSDDIYMPWTLHAVAEIFSQYPDVDWIIGAYSNTQNGVIRYTFTSRPIPQEMIRAGCFHEGPHGFGYIQQESCFWRKRLWEKAKPLSLDLRFAADFELWTRFAKYTKLYPVSTLLGGFCMRGDENRSRANRGRYMEEVQSTICQVRSDRSSPEYRLARRLQLYVRLRDSLGTSAALRLIPVRHLRGPVLRWNSHMSRYDLQEEIFFKRDSPSLYPV